MFQLWLYIALSEETYGSAPDLWYCLGYNCPAAAAAVRGPFRILAVLVETAACCKHDLDPRVQRGLFCKKPWEKNKLENP